MMSERTLQLSMYSLLLWILLVSLAACSSEGEPTPTSPQAVTPTITINNASIVEVAGNATMEFEIKLDRTDFTSDITIEYSTVGITAEPGVDFVETSSNVTIAVGQSPSPISITILDDDEREIQETFTLQINNVTNGQLANSSATGTITDTDAAHLSDEDGYNTAAAYYGYDLLFEETFDSGLDEEIFNFDLGDGCNQNLCGWGNNELQSYSSAEENVTTTDGRLVITTTREETGAYKSARLNTKGKLEFQFGRIDVRAKLPEGQGLWPAIWMLGANIDEVGWPACGEIDIMELVGSEPNQVLGTAHWGEPSQPSTFKSGVYNDPKKFSESFHVFSLIWELNELHWYVDETKFHTIDRSVVSPAQYRFNQKFYFLFNVAIGGNLPGNPDETTMLPQTMEIDYIRVFQPN